MGLVDSLVEQWRDRTSELRRLYVEGGRRKIAETLGLRYNTTGHFLKRVGFYAKEVQKDKRLFNVGRSKCVNPFNSGWTADLAYFVGYFLGDGSLCKKKGQVSGYQTTVFSNDQSVIASFAKMFGSEVKRRVYKQGYKDGFYFSVVDQTVYNKMLELGFRPNKSVVGCNLPPVPKEYLPSFLRGLFDSDGCVSYSNHGKQLRVEICGHPSYMRQLLELNLLPFKSHFYENIYRLTLHATESVKSFADYIYSQPGLCLVRKRERFEQMYGKQY